MVKLIPVEGIGEIVPGDDLAEILTATASLAEGDVVVVTSKIVAKAAGLVTERSRDEVLADETDRVVARRGGTSIVRTHHGLTMAAAGIDASNVADGHVISLPSDPDGDARRLRTRIAELAGVTVGILIADTAGRPWRQGQTDMAIGCAGIVPIRSFAGQTDAHGNPLVVTAPAIADEIAGAAELVSGKLGGRPFVILRGLDPTMLTADDGPGATALVRDEGHDLFGLGSREAVLAAMLRTSRRGFPDPAGEWESVDAVLAAASPRCRREGSRVLIERGDDDIEAGALSERVKAVAFAYGLAIEVKLA
ncbi:coenzyme F420-0:L-glutamate ligase [Aeromicrobium sp. PE09-221]|uniref:coenzyme F420-0:L-glutamate ligase n=1 Tax=Aeromicrobium sp. PE09-221 TaxID=1898043 RepID=UPI000B3E76CB|nr:coenzyme F420-0:L-glutamate ligase [Aeromicrobium sp. PE09-221]